MSESPVPIERVIDCKSCCQFSIWLSVGLSYLTLIYLICCYRVQYDDG